MKSFKIGKVDTENVNATLIELNKAFTTQASRNANALNSMEAAYTVLSQYDSKLDSIISNLVYYKTYYTTICEKNGV